MNAIGWKFMAIYCGWLGIEFIVVFLLYPETHGRTLEELAFCKSRYPKELRSILIIWLKCSRTGNLLIRPLRRLKRKSIPTISTIPTMSTKFRIRRQPWQFRKGSMTVRRIIVAFRQ